MAYRPESTEGRFLRGEIDAVGTVSRWISIVLASYRFRHLREQRFDLHQDAMARIVEALQREQYDSGMDLRVYVQAIARHLALRALVRQERGIPEGAGEASLGSSAGTSEARQMESLLVEEVLSRLHDPCRSLILKYFIAEQSYEEIGAELGIPVGTVKSKLYRCLEAAHRELSRPGSTRPAPRSSAARREP